MSKKHNSAVTSDSPCYDSNFLGIPAYKSGPARDVLVLDRWTARALLSAIGNPPINVVMWNCESISTGNITPVGKLLIKLMFNPEFSFGDLLHYAKTLGHWLQRYEANTDEITGMYDEVFTRAWSLYLTGSIAAFTSGEMQLFQVLFSRPQNNQLSLTRAHLYT